MAPSSAGNGQEWHCGLRALLGVGNSGSVVSSGCLFPFAISFPGCDSIIGHPYSHMGPHGPGNGSADSSIIVDTHKPARAADLGIDEDFKKMENRGLGGIGPENSLEGQTIGSL